MVGFHVEPNATCNCTRCLHKHTVLEYHTSLRCPCWNDRQSYCTPTHILHALLNYYKVGFDLAACESNTLAPLFSNNMQQYAKGGIACNGVVWANPPFKRFGELTQVIAHSAANQCCLVPWRVCIAENNLLCSWAKLVYHFGKVQFWVECHCAAKPTFVKLPHTSYFHVCMLEVWGQSL